MNKKMLLVVLVPFAAHAHLKELGEDIQAKVNGLHGLATAPFGGSLANLNPAVAAVSHELAQSYVKSVVSAVDTKFLDKTLVDTKGVKVATGDVLSFAAAVAVSCANDKLSGSKNSHAQNAASHAATRLVVAALNKAYGAAAPKVASLVGVEKVSLDATINERFPGAVGATINSVRTTLVDAAVYSIVRDAVARVTVGFFAKP